MNQTTLKNEAVLEGIGLHTGEKSRLVMKPAEPDMGVVFYHGGQEIPAHVSHVSSTMRNTSLVKNGITVYTVEHALSALHGLGIDNAIVEMDCPEPPALDGSAGPYTEALLAAGIEESDVPAKTLGLRGQVLVGGRGCYVLCLPSDTFQATYILEYEHPMVGRQGFTFTCGDGEEYRREVAPARTFALEEEIEGLKRAGLALGGGYENAIVVRQDGYSSDLRFPDEFARHKLLDLVGDVRLLGAVRPAFHIIGVRSGHALNAEAMKAIAAQSDR